LSYPMTAVIVTRTAYRWNLSPPISITPWQET
jgi:hypothetical protein